MFGFVKNPGTTSLSSVFREPVFPRKSSQSITQNYKSICQRFAVTLLRLESPSVTTWAWSISSWGCGCGCVCHCGKAVWISTEVMSSMVRHAIALLGWSRLQIMVR